MEFDFDPEKSLSNQAKHGIDFSEAQALWLDGKRLIVPARTSDESRFALIGEWEGRLWTCIFTPRGQTIRIISVRRARHEEEARYDQGRGV